MIQLRYGIIAICIAICKATSSNRNVFASRHPFKSFSPRTLGFVAPSRSQGHVSMTSERRDIESSGLGSLSSLSCSRRNKMSCSPSPLQRHGCRQKSSKIYSLASATETGVDMEDVKTQIESAIANTDRGRSISSPTQKQQIHTLLSTLEHLFSQSPNRTPYASQPARDPRMEGAWIVLYTDAPPPSNGQLLFWKGVAKQVIDLKGGRYKNELCVGGTGTDGDEGAWLSAVLDASWCEWDGVYLDAPAGAGGEVGVAAGDGIDYGATTWKVTFDDITLSLFGNPIFTQKFKEGTSRTWKMTYLDDDTRVVRAGKTGREEDDWIFYMKRGN